MVWIQTKTCWIDLPTEPIEQAAKAAHMRLEDYVAQVLNETQIMGIYQDAIIWFTDDDGVQHWGSPQEHAEMRAREQRFKDQARDAKRYREETAKARNALDLDKVKARIIRTRSRSRGSEIDF